MYITLNYESRTILAVYRLGLLVDEITIVRICTMYCALWFLPIHYAWLLSLSLCLTEADRRKDRETTPTRGRDGGTGT